MYKYELEKHGRVRKNVEELLSGSTVVDFEPVILNILADKQDKERFEKVYSLYITKGYDYV